jgi:adenosylcobyric acid synthase
VKARLLWRELADPKEEVHGYEIHMGQSRVLGRGTPLLQIVERNGKPVRVKDGLISNDGRVWGSYLHGLFDNDGLRHRLIRRLMSVNDVELTKERLGSFNRWKEEQYDKLASHLRSHLDMDRIYQIIGIADHHK